MHEFAARRGEPVTVLGHAEGVCVPAGSLFGAADDEMRGEGVKALHVGSSLRERRFCPVLRSGSWMFLTPSGAGREQSGPA